MHGVALFPINGAVLCVEIANGEAGDFVPARG